MVYPKKEMDLKSLEKLVAMGCTDVEISAFFNISTRTITEKRKQEPYKTLFEETHAKTRISLRRQQLKMALEKDNVTMLIWLGKVMLGQKDTMQLSGDAESPLKFDGKIEIIHIKPGDIKP